MTKEEAHEALDQAAQQYAAVVFADDGAVGMVQWVLSAHVDILDTNESGYTQAASGNLPLHDRLGLLRYAQLHAEQSALTFGHDEED